MLCTFLPFSEHSEICIIGGGACPPHAVLVKGNCLGIIVNDHFNHTGNVMRLLITK